jgi:transcriptional regulator with XRE-family HTH domain
MRIGKALKKARQDAGLTQEELAAKAGIHRVYLSELERDTKSPTIEIFDRLCRAAGTSASKVLARAEKATET